MQSFVDRGATATESPKELAEAADIVVTCLPSPSISAEVMDASDGVIAGLAPGKIWMEMSTTDEQEIRRLAALVEATGATPVECPVSGGCHRAATGNIAIFCGGPRDAFEKALPVLTMMGRRILHTGPLGSASVLKVVTNYLASINLVGIGEAFAVAHAAGMDMTTTYEAIRISSGNSFVHETEGQVILNGSYDINFTLDLVQKDMGLFLDVAGRAGLNLEVGPQLLEIFDDAAERYGSREFSPTVVRRMEEQLDTEFRAPGFPPEMVDEEAEAPGYEVVVGTGPGTD